MKNLSDLKKTMVMGTKIKMLSFDGQTPPEKIQGIREVVKVQTNGVYLGDPEKSPRSFFDFPKAKDITFHTEKHFTIKDVFGSREYLLIS